MTMRWTEPRHYHDPKGKLYATRIYEGGQEVCSVNVRDPQHEERARLIGAAPELRAALEEYQRLVAYLQRTTNPEEWATHGDWKKLQAGAEAALAKARGQS
jgi:hypothetical protein